MMVFGLHSNYSFIKYHIMLIMFRLPPIYLQLTFFDFLLWTCHVHYNDLDILMQDQFVFIAKSTCVYGVACPHRPL